MKKIFTVKWVIAERLSPSKMSAKIDFMFKINMWYVSADQAETYDEKSNLMQAFG
jgi:hypothetical protein